MTIQESVLSGCSGDELIQISLNGQTFEVPSGCTVSRMLELAEMRQQLIAVEVNKEVVPKAQHGDTLLQPGDMVEVVSLVGGG